MVLQIEDDRD
uniref:Uncharacterized protein n=1 Tax=Anguilla anguilla TaxID=7936 RepID=A0A0E9VSJ2_ANGAN